MPAIAWSVLTSPRGCLRAQEHFPEIRYEKMGLQEMHFREAFDGVICIDALEHVCPEDYPGILRSFQEALKPGGVLYFTVDTIEVEEVESAYERAKERGLPLVLGEVVDGVEEAYERAKVPGQSVPIDLADRAVYHYYPPLEQVRAWIDQAGLEIEKEGAGSGYHHFVVRKKEE